MPVQPHQKVDQENDYRQPDDDANHLVKRFGNCNVIEDHQMSQKIRPATTIVTSSDKSVEPAIIWPPENGSLCLSDYAVSAVGHIWT